MGTKQRFAIQSLIATVILNAVLLAAIFVLVGNTAQPGNRTLIVVALGVVITVLLWLTIFYIGSRVIGREAPAPTATTGREVAPARASRAASDGSRPAERAGPVEPSRSSEAGAVQMLAILQRQGRLIDFLQEDLSMYDDAQIGAAVRSIHDGCRQALADHAKLEPIFQESEGSTVTVQLGFDTRAVRLMGDVVGEPPFHGELRHRGWRVASIDLPRQVPGQPPEMIVAAAEVEVKA